jgi:dienelactone hydrolase
MKKITALPKPAGSYQVGLVRLNFVDENRTDPFPAAKGEKRDVPLIIWYPIDDPGARLPSKMLKIRDLVSFKRYFLYKFIPNRICDIVTNSYQDAPLSDKNAKFPALIFNHGFSSYMEQNTILMEHLASFGYVVLSVGHPYDGVASYPDGRSIPVDLESIKALSKDMRQHQKTFNQNIKQLARNDLSVEEMRKYTENYLNTSKAMNDKVEMWIADIRFIVGILEKMNEATISSRFAHKLELEKGIGVFGQSYGGAASVLASCLDDRLTCGINIDGAMYGGTNAKYQYRRPTMYMDSDMLPGRSRYFFHTNENDTYHVIIKNSRHLDYSDYTYILKNWLLKLMQLVGKVDGSLMTQITNDYVRSFFDKYIKQLDAPLLEQNPYREVVFESRLVSASQDYLIQTASG